MQNIKPLQTSKPRIMSNKEAMEELERYKPPINKGINEEIIPYKNFLSKREQEAMTGLENLLGEKPKIVDGPSANDFEISIENNTITYLCITSKNLNEIPEQINKLTNLQTLVLSYNKIKLIKDIGWLTNLHVFSINNNPIINKKYIDVLRKKGVRVYF